MFMDDSKLGENSMKCKYSCPAHIMAFAYISMIYVISSIVYYLITRCMGTPFMNSITQEQKKIKKKSTKQRANVFMFGIICGIIVIHIIDPFSAS